MCRTKHTTETNDYRSLPVTRNHHMCVSAYGVSTLLLECLASVQHLRDSDNKRKTTAYLAWRKKVNQTRQRNELTEREKRGE